MGNLSVGVQKRGNRLQELIKQFHVINGEAVEVGHFKKQGRHPSGFTYAELMAIHHNGSNPSGTTSVPPRPVLDLLFFRNQKLTDPIFKQAFKEWKNRALSMRSNDKLLEELGRILRDKEKEIFGSSALAPNAVPPKDRNEPLVASGELRSKVAYRASTNKQIKEG